MVSIGVNEVIKRLQDTMAKDNDELKKSIGGAVNLETILDNTSIHPMSFHVAYTGATPDEQYVYSNEYIKLRKNFTVFVVLNVEKFNGRLPQSLIPKVEERLIYSLWCWDFDLKTDNCHGAMTYDGDEVIYVDRGRYLHAFNFSIDYTVQYTEIDDEIYDDGGITFFDTLIADYFVGQDDEGNDIYNRQEIINIYNEGEELT